jgi:geranyl-CoA carboxylase alpha subunit
VPAFHKVLVANRGEIACRIMRTARGMGYRTVAVFSEADAHAPHVALADEAVCIGPPAATHSYLKVEALLDAARRTGADAIHPGYGFLSENAAFAQAVLDAGLTLIGPPPDAMRLMGDKARAKKRMQEAGVPTAPGYLGEDQADARLAQEAGRVGYPLLIKAVAGGGGRGIRVVRSAEAFEEHLQSARREAQSAFGDATVMLERMVEDGRHVEIQVFADAHGNAVYLGERDCTAQRRRQKVIEEAPSPICTPQMRRMMGEAAVAAAKAVGYRGAGTVEFIVGRAGEAFFLEMNTRLQVEHPVTELVFGVDLVRWQLLVAAGEPLPMRQEDLRPRGHAIEVRLYAEDPYAAFAPQTGKVLHWRPQAAAQQPGVRVDDGLTEGGVITPFYDAMVAKVMAHGADRTEAIRRLVAALEDAPLLGLRNNGRFLCDLLQSDAFRQAQMTTTLLDRWVDQGHPVTVETPPSEVMWALAAALRTDPGAAAGLHSRVTPGFDLTLSCGAQNRALRVERAQDGAVDAGGTVVRLNHAQDHQVRFEHRGVHGRGTYVVDGRQVHLCVGGRWAVFTEPDPLVRRSAQADPGRLLAPVAGVVVKVMTQRGASVNAGDALLIIEAMKMETRVMARAAGTVKELRARVGGQVEAGELLVTLDVTGAARGS